MFGRLMYLGSCQLKKLCSWKHNSSDLSGSLFDIKDFVKSRYAKIVLEVSAHEGILESFM